MDIRIDRIADAVLITWASRASGASRVVQFEQGAGVRLLLDDESNVVGLEILGYSRRTADPQSVTTTFSSDGEVLDEEHPLVQEIFGGGGAEVRL